MDMHKNVHTYKYRELVKAFAEYINEDGTYPDYAALTARDASELWHCTSRNAHYQLARMEKEGLLKTVVVAGRGKPALGFIPVGDMQIDTIDYFDREFFWNLNR